MFTTRLGLNFSKALPKARPQFAKPSTGSSSIWRSTKRSISSRLNFVRRPSTPTFVPPEAYSKYKGHTQPLGTRIEPEANTHLDRIAPNRFAPRRLMLGDMPRFPQAVRHQVPELYPDTEALRHRVPGNYFQYRAEAFNAPLRANAKPIVRKPVPQRPDRNGAAEAFAPFRPDARPFVRNPVPQPPVRHKAEAPLDLTPHELRLLGEAGAFNAPIRPDAIPVVRNRVPRPPVLNEAQANFALTPRELRLFGEAEAYNAPFGPDARPVERNRVPQPPVRHEADAALDLNPRELRLLGEAEAFNAPFGPDARPVERNRVPVVQDRIVDMDPIGHMLGLNHRQNIHDPARINEASKRYQNTVEFLKQRTDPENVYKDHYELPEVKQQYEKLCADILGFEKALSGLRDQHLRQSQLRGERIPADNKRFHFDNFGKCNVGADAFGPARIRKGGSDTIAAALAAAKYMVHLSAPDKELHIIPRDALFNVWKIPRCMNNDQERIEGLGNLIIALADSLNRCPGGHMGYVLEANSLSYHEIFPQELSYDEAQKNLSDLMDCEKQKGHPEYKARLYQIFSDHDHAALKQFLREASTVDGFKIKDEFIDDYVHNCTKDLTKDEDWHVYQDIYEPDQD